MGYDNRKKFWFGTESRMEFFATPLQGADSSPSAWGADGTLLNGGGWALNSWGSHKRYTYEWPASSSRETAQKMKSYRDGTYGRGLLYFLEPTIFTTNVLPANWADPSMAIDNEAPSLVYGIEPSPVATSGGANLGLPITSALYDLSGVTPQTVPTPDSSVFIPIPTGHTLFLGAFYSSTGTGGVFATPVNSNGTLGTAVRLTEKSNSDTDVVTDPFSGDLRGVRLWVGRTSGSASTVTIAAMAGRLIESSDLPVYSPWVEQSRNLSQNPLVATGNFWGTQTSASWPISTGVTPPVDHPLGVTTSVESRLMGTGTHLANLYDLGEPGTGVGTVQRMIGAWVLVTEPGYSTDSTGGFEVASLPANQWVFVRTVNPTGAGVRARLSVRADAGNASNTARVYVTGVVTTGGTTPVGQPWTPNLPDTDTSRYTWVGAINLSQSTWEVRRTISGQAKLAQLESGPWVGGQGHSGCRFLGTPSYVTNSPIEGGRIGFAATFVEVGSWVYG